MGEAATTQSNQPPHGLRAVLSSRRGANREPNERGGLRGSTLRPGHGDAGCEKLQGSTVKHSIFRALCRVFQHSTSRKTRSLSRRKRCAHFNRQIFLFEAAYRPIDVSAPPPGTLCLDSEPLW